MEIEIVASEPRAPWPYAQAVILRDGDIMVCSGQVAFDEDRNIVGRGDLMAQTRKTFDNIKTLLDKSGASMDQIVHLTVYLTKMREFPRLGEIARQYLSEPFPGMTLIGIKELGWPDLMVEIQAIVGMPRTK